MRDQHDAQLAGRPSETHLATILLEPPGIQFLLFRLFSEPSYAHHGHHIHVVVHGRPSFLENEEKFGLRVERGKSDRVG